VISAPVADTTPVWPPLLLILAGGVFVGLGGSVAFVLFRDTIQPVARMPRDVEQLTGLPVLANLPEEPALRASARA
jgi:capsular polysaccharide biosynthesis protein